MANTRTQHRTKSEIIPGLPAMTIEALRANLESTIFNVKSGTDVQVLDKDGNAAAVLVTPEFYKEHKKS